MGALDVIIDRIIIFFSSFLSRKCRRSYSRYIVPRFREYYINDIKNSSIDLEFDKIDSIYSYTYISDDIKTVKKAIQYINNRNFLRLEALNYKIPRGQDEFGYAPIGPLGEILLLIDICGVGYMAIFGGSQSITTEHQLMYFKSVGPYKINRSFSKGLIYQKPYGVA